MVRAPPIVRAPTVCHKQCKTSAAVLVCMHWKHCALMRDTQKKSKTSLLKLLLVCAARARAQGASHHLTPTRATGSRVFHKSMRALPSPRATDGNQVAIPCRPGQASPPPPPRCSPSIRWPAQTNHIQLKGPRITDTTCASMELRSLRNSVMSCIACEAQLNHDHTHTTAQ